MIEREAIKLLKRTFLDFDIRDTVNYLKDHEMGHT